MELKSYNKALAAQCNRGLNESFVKNIEPGYQEYYYCSDTDTVRYKMITSKDKFTLYFYFIDLENIWKYIEQYFRKTYYQNFSVKLKKQGNEPLLEILLDIEGFTALNKTTPVPQETGITTGRKPFQWLIQLLSKRLASIKRHFLASPFEIALEAAKANASDKGNRLVPNFSFYIKPDKKEKVWIAFQKTQLTVYYGLNFEDKFQQQLAKIFFSELSDAKKHIHNAPSVSVSDREIPRMLIDSFPQEKMEKYNFTNGIVDTAIFGNLVKSHRSLASYLSAFRNYTYYHIQAWKVYLHSRVLRRINIILKDLNQAKIEPFAQN